MHVSPYIYSAFSRLTLKSSMLVALVYWYVWTRLIPRWRGYSLEDELEVLGDGTTVNRLVHVYK